MDSRDDSWQRVNRAMLYFSAAALVLIVGATAVAMLCGGAINPPPGETCTQCVREWIGSLSGWVAALAAAATIAAMLGQLKQMRRQTDHVVGADMVELAWEQDEESLALGLPGTIVLYVQNLGRRPIRITRIVVIERIGAVRCALYVNEKNAETGIDFAADSEFGDYRDFSFVYKVPGRDQDEKSKNRANFKILIMAPGYYDENLCGDEVFDIEVHYYTLGESLQITKRVAKVDLSFIDGLVWFLFTFHTTLPKKRAGAGAVTASNRCQAQLSLRVIPVPSIQQSRPTETTRESSGWKGADCEVWIQSASNSSHVGASTANRTIIRCSTARDHGGLVMMQSAPARSGRWSVNASRVSIQPSPGARS